MITPASSAADMVWEEAILFNSSSGSVAALGVLEEEGVGGVGAVSGMLSTTGIGILSSGTPDEGLGGEVRGSGGLAGEARAAGKEGEGGDGDER
jgi:hypothetical protein